ncbi:MAG: SGNH/GDSL hydrolase family protein [Candidatus Aminicenantes bacterium]|nr:SGNH/GDSL hydrolase family protein [Candidatus Aminicenantes bacterium]
MMGTMARRIRTALVLGLGIWSVFGCRGRVLTVCCAGDSLMQPIPVHLRAIASAAGENLRIVEMARGGLSTDTYRGFFRQSLEEGRNARFLAVLLQLGTNDVLPILEGRETPEDFRERFREILAGFRKLGAPGRPRPALLVATIPRFCENPESEAKNEIVESVLNPIVREVAAAAGAAVVDNHAVLRDRPDLYDPDGVHPNGAGERALAENWWRTLKFLKE